MPGYGHQLSMAEADELVVDGLGAGEDNGIDLMPGRVKQQ
jgi:hypothetical protein